MLGTLPALGTRDAGLVTTEVVDDYAAFLALEREWNEAIERANVPHPFLRHEWVRTWWDSFQGSRELHIIVVRHADRIVGIAPLMRETATLYGLPIRRLALLANDHTPRTDFLVSGDADEVYRAIWNALRDDIDHWDVVQLTQLLKGSPTSVAMTRFAAAEGLPVGTWKSTDSPYLELSGTWERYWASLPAKFRSNVRNRLSRLTQIGEPALEILSDKTAIAGACDDAWRLEASGWKDQEGTSITSDPAVRKFYTLLAERGADGGWLRLVFLTVGGRRIAVSYSAVADGRLFLLHLEEDAGKNVHEGLPDVDRYSYVDLNRAGTPLAEIVTEPDFRSSWEAYDYVNHVRRALQWVGASEADMEKGNLRCEANVSVRRQGDTTFGTKVELKNLNSVRFMQKAIEFEVERHIKTLESGGRLFQETRLWDDRLNETRPMRSKEEAHDYRYFPEPDLPPLIVTQELIDQVQAAMPELPGPRAKRFAEQYGLSFADASQLTGDRSLADYYETAVEASGGNARATGNWIRSELLRELENAGLTAAKSPVSAVELGALVRMIDEGTISGKQGKDVLIEMFSSGKPAAAIVEERGLVQVSDTGEIDHVIDEVIASNPKQVEQFRGGKEGLFGFFVGQVMKASKGKANPKIVNERLRQKLK